MADGKEVKLVGVGELEKFSLLCLLSLQLY